MKIRMTAVLLAVLTVLTLAGCKSSVWGDENLLAAAKGSGTAFTDAGQLFTLYAPENFQDTTASDPDASNLMLTGDGIEIRVTCKDYVQNLAVSDEEAYTEEYKNLGMKLTSYTRGKVLGANGIKITGSFTENEVAMQQVQYAFNEGGKFYVFTCSYPSEQAKEARKTINAVLGSFEVTAAE